MDGHKAQTHAICVAVAWHITERKGHELFLVAFSHSTIQLGAFFHKTKAIMIYGVNKIKIIYSIILENESV